MAKGLIERDNLTAIAGAIREKNGEETQYKPSEMAEAIKNLPSGGGATLDMNELEWIDIYNSSRDAVSSVALPENVAWEDIVIIIGVAAARTSDEVTGNSIFNFVFSPYIKTKMWLVSNGIQWYTPIGGSIYNYSSYYKGVFAGVPGTANVYGYSNTGSVNIPWFGYNPNTNKIGLEIMTYSKNLFNTDTATVDGFRSTYIPGRGHILIGIKKKVE